MSRNRELKYRWQKLPCPEKALVWLKTDKGSHYLGYKIVYPDPWWPLRNREDKQMEVYLHSNKDHIDETVIEWCDIMGPTLAIGLIERHNKLVDIENE